MTAEPGFTARSFARHGLALVSLLFSWRYLSLWYQFRNRYDYWLFAGSFIAALLLAGGPLLLRALSRLNPPRLLILMGLFVPALPWGEWLRLNFDFAREDWTRQIFKQAIFLYGAISFFRLFPGVAKIIAKRTNQILDQIFATRYLLWLPCFLFFCLSGWIAVFVTDKTPFVQDSAAHLFQAKIFSEGKLFSPAPPVSDFFSYQGDMLVMKDGRWFSMYPPLFSALLAIASLLGAEWFLSPFLGALTIGIWISYLKRWHGGRVASLFAYLSLFSPFLFLMSSSVMVHVLELFVATAVVYLCRLESERQTKTRLFALYVLMMLSILTRGFSLLPFFAPVLLYVGWKKMKTASYAFPVFLVAGILCGAALLAFYQWKTTGDPGVSGYVLEYPGYRYGFGSSLLGLIHTPARGLENISNNILGLNSWLTGWYSGSLFFVALFFVLVPKMQLWDRLLLLCCGALVLFYYFFIAQDLVFGPRFFYLLAPVVLLCIVRSCVGDEGEDTQRPAVVTALLAFSVVSFLPQRLPAYATRFDLREGQAKSLRREIDRLGEQKTILFLGERVDSKFVGWNDPFLRDPVLILRDPAMSHQAAEEAFPGYQPVYFGLHADFSLSKKNDSFRLEKEQSGQPSGYLSLFELAIAIEGARHYPDQDCFDMCYSGLFKTKETAAQLKYLEGLIADPLEKEGYQKDFRLGILYAGHAMLLPKLAFEEKGMGWQGVFDVRLFVREFDSSLRHLQAAGETGKNIHKELQKVQRRIDQNRDRRLQDDEVREYLGEKLKAFWLS